MRGLYRGPRIGSELDSEVTWGQQYLCGGSTPHSQMLTPTHRDKNSKRYSRRVPGSPAGPGRIRRCSSGYTGKGLTELRGRWRKKEKFWGRESRREAPRWPEGEECSIRDVQRIQGTRAQDKLNRHIYKIDNLQGPTVEASKSYGMICNKGTESGRYSG